MNSGKNSSLNVEEFYLKAGKYLKLEPVKGKTGFSKSIDQSSLNKDFCGILIWGKKEIQSLNSLSADSRRRYIEERLRDGPSCLILTDGLSCLPEVIEEAGKREIAVFCSMLPRAACREKIKEYFESLGKQNVTISGGLLKVFGLGVLIVGDSGIGKSESALELISRGHSFISDDVVQVEKTARGKIFGKAPEVSRYFMEIRGLGLINIKEIFGPGLVLDRAEIKLVIQLKKWQQGVEYDRIGLKFPEDYEILGRKIPVLSIPVAPGRNIATLIEVACKVHILRSRGYNASDEMIRRLNRALSHS